MLYRLKILDLKNNNERINFNHIGKKCQHNNKEHFGHFLFFGQVILQIIVFKLKSSSRGFVFGLDSQASPFLKTLLINGLAKWNTSITVICSKDLTVNLWEKKYVFRELININFDHMKMKITEGKIILLFKDCMFVRHLFDLKLCQLFLVLKRASRKQILTKHFKITTI